MNLFTRPRWPLVIRLRNEGIAARMASLLVSQKDQLSGPRETFLRLRAEEARHSVRYPGRKRR
jgi:hypothetical protein